MWNLISIGPVVSEEKMFENVDAGVIGILIAHFGAFGSGELKRRKDTGKELPPDIPQVFLL